MRSLLLDVNWKMLQHQPRRLQMFFALMAALFLPWPTFRPIETSFTWGDVFLIPAILLNLDRALRIRAWQIPMLLALPFILISQIQDPDGTLIEVGQVLYIYGLIVPFGWVAFADLRPRLLCTVLLASACFSSLTAVAQFAGWIDVVGRQSIWEVQGAMRAAGCSLSCSSLCMTLSPLFPLLLYIPDYRLRMGIMVILLLGLTATMAKSTIFILPGLLFFLWKEPNRRGVVTMLSITGFLSFAAFAVSGKLQETIEAWNTSITYRVDRVGNSFDERSSTLQFALSFLDDCYITGLGYKRTLLVLTQHLGNTVHVFHVGLILIGGLIMAVLHSLGIGLLMLRLKRLDQMPATMMMLGQVLAVCTMTVLMLSFQYLPYMICGAIIDWQLRRAAVPEAARKTAGQPLSSQSRLLSPLPGLPAGTV